MTNLDSNPLQTKIVDSNELAYIKHNRMLTEMIAKDHEIIQNLKQELIMTQEQLKELTELLKQISPKKKA
jgi:predicted nucleic acid-binding protein